MRTGSWCVHYLISDPMVKDNNLRLINNELFQLFLQAVYCSEVRTSKLIFYLQLNFNTQFKIQFKLNCIWICRKKYMKHDDFVTWIIVCHIKGTYDLVFKKIKLSFFLDHYNWGNVISWLFVESQYTIHSLHMLALLYSKKKLLFDLFSKELSWIFALMTLVKCQTIYSK